MKKILLLLLFFCVALTLFGCGPSGSKGLTVEEKKQLVANMETETLDRFYVENPSLKEKVEQSAGYGVFSNANVNVIFASAGGGFGVVNDNSTGEKTYMKMGMGGVGLGVGVKDYRVLLVFNDKKTLDKFIEKGWEFGAQADAAAKASNKGGELGSEGNLDKEIEVYAMTEAGLALQATITGTKYWKDKELN